VNAAAVDDRSRPYTNLHWKVTIMKLLYRVNEAAEACSIGRTKTYELINRGELRAVKIDGAVRIPASAIEEFVHRLEADSTVEVHSAA
jgi:excisionase family DNA binding protein